MAKECPKVKQAKFDRKNKLKSIFVAAQVHKKWKNDFLKYHANPLFRISIMKNNYCAS